MKGILYKYKMEWWKNLYSCNN